MQTFPTIVEAVTAAGLYVQLHWPALSVR